MITEEDITIVKQVEIPEALISLRSDGIMYVYYKKNMVLDVPLQMEMVELYRQMLGPGQTAGFIFQADEGFVVTKEARENSIKLEENTPVKACGIVVTQLASRMVANFFIKINKPRLPYKILANVEEAARWLRTL